MSASALTDQTEGSASVLTSCRGEGGGASVGLNSISHAAPRITAATAEPQLQLPEIRGPEGGQ